MGSRRSSEQEARDCASVRGEQAWDNPQAVPRRKPDQYPAGIRVPLGPGRVGIEPLPKGLCHPFRPPNPKVNQAPETAYPRGSQGWLPAPRAPWQGYR